MHCNVDGDDRPTDASADWVDDSEWGLVHFKRQNWHTVTGTRLQPFPDGGFMAQSSGPALPDLPSPLPRPGHPGLPRRPALPEEYESPE